MSSCQHATKDAMFCKYKIIFLEVKYRTIVLFQISKSVSFLENKFCSYSSYLCQIGKMVDKILSQLLAWLHTPTVWLKKKMKKKTCDGNYPTQYQKRAVMEMQR